MKVALVIPAFNEHATIGEVVSTARDFGEPVVVDDGSTDDTGSIARSHGAVVVRHETNLGYDRALRSGILRALDDGADVIATLDADGQHDPNLVHAFIEPLVDGDSGLVLGVRSEIPRVTERLFNAFTRARFGVPDILCGLKAYRADVVRAHAAELDRATIGTGLALAALRSGARASLVPVAVRPRSGSSRFGTVLTANARIGKALFVALTSEVTNRHG